MEEKKNEYKREKIEEWNKEEDEEDWQRIKEDRKYLEELGDENYNIGNLRDLYDELWRSPWNEDSWEEGGVINHQIPLSHYLFFFSFSFN